MFSDSSKKIVKAILISAVAKFAVSEGRLIIDENCFKKKNANTF